MRPVVDGLDQRYGDRVAFAGVDFYHSANAPLAERYGVTGHPTFVVVGPDGKEAARFRGFTEEADLEAALKEVAGS